MTHPIVYGPACAHRNIEYRKVYHDGGTCSDSWICRDCGSPFALVNTPPREVEELRALVRRPWAFIECKVTGNPCGTDTWMNAYVCPCPGCQEWLRAQADPPATGKAE